MGWLRRELAAAAAERAAHEERRIRADEMRGEIAWFMNVRDLVIGHDMLGFDYPVDGDDRPTIRA